MKLCGFEAGLDQPFFLIAGPCTAESEQLCVDVAGRMKEICARLGVNYIFKASYDKANRSSGKSVRGPGIEGGLKILESVRAQIGVPVLTDVHDAADVAQVASVVDVLQTPAFLCRQTDLLHAAAQTGKPVNVKKGQFLSPMEMKNVIAKLTESGCSSILLTERGSSFGYGNLVVDFQGFPHLRRTGCPVLFDATHSVQKPGGLGHATGGAREMIPTLARAAATCVDGFFFEVHEAPERALSDGPNAMPLDRFGALLDQLLELWRAGRRAALEDLAGLPQ